MKLVPKTEEGAEAKLNRDERPLYVRMHRFSVA